jgi:peptidoglycan LD-endopeptidase CwlK
MDQEMIVDSALPDDAAKRQNPRLPCPPEILALQAVLPVEYWSFDQKLHKGQVVIDSRLADDIRSIFDHMLHERFPLTSVIPIADERFSWSDDASMAANNSSAFNYRAIAGTSRLSLHALGQAIDLNPLLNPYIVGDVAQPPGAIYDPSRVGTMTADSFLVRIFEKLGWEWGGRWKDRKDYHHFQKPVASIS